MNEDRHEVFRGHLEECLKHLGTSFRTWVPKGSRKATQVKKPLADFCGVMTESVSRWMYSTSSLPVGEPLIKLKCYLDMVGYRVIELERMPKVQRNFAELIGFGILSSDQASEFLGYASVSRLYEILRGDCDTSDEKEQKMWEVWKKRKEELEGKKEQAKELYRLDTPLKVRLKAEEVKPAMLFSRQAAVVSIMEGLLALLEEGSFKKPSEDNLADLQRSADTILRLSAHLSALSSQLITSKQWKGGS